MTWITLELGHAPAPHSRADAERPGRHSHAERRNDQRDLKHVDHAHAHAHACAQRYTRVPLRFARLADLCITLSAERGDDHHRITRGRSGALWLSLASQRRQITKRRTRMRCLQTRPAVEQLLAQRALGVFGLVDTTLL